nr:hypothetical protein [Tanacetum cinerariifolium]
MNVNPFQTIKVNATLAVAIKPNAPFRQKTKRTLRGFTKKTQTHPIGGFVTTNQRTLMGLRNLNAPLVVLDGDDGWLWLVVLVVRRWLCRGGVAAIRCWCGGDDDVDFVEMMVRVNREMVVMADDGEGDEGDGGDGMAVTMMMIS